MFFVVTMYKGADGAFERKEYSLKAQSRVTKGRPDTGVAAAIAKLSTFAKTTFDLAPHASLEHRAEGTPLVLFLDSPRSKFKGVSAAVSINVTWLKNHTPDADAMTDLSGVSGLSALGADSSASDVSGLDSLAADSDQDLAGFEDARPAASADDESPPGRATKPTAKPSHRPPFMSPIQDVDSPSKEMGTPGVGERAARDSVGERWTAAATKLGSPAPSPSSTRKRMLLKYESPIKASSNDAEAAGSGIGRTARALFQGVLFATHLGTKSGRGDPSVAAALREELDAVEDVRQLVKTEVAMQEEVDAAAEAAEEAKAEGTAEAKTDAEAEAKKDPSPESTLAASHQETPSADAFAEATAAAEAAREEAASLREQLEETSADAAAAAIAAREDVADLRESLAEASSAAEAAREEAASLREQLEDTSAVAAAAAEAAQEEVTEAEERAANLRERLYSTSTELASAAKAAENAAQAEATLLREAAKKTLARAQRFVLSRAFDGWVWRVSQKRRLRALAQRATERLTKNAKAMTFREWRRTARENIGVQGSKAAREEAENLRAKLWRDRVARSERFLLALMRHKLRRAFASWSTTTRESRRRIRAATKILARAQRFALSRAFDGWVWRASEKRRLRALAQRATERLTKNAKAMTFREWRRTARENIEAQAAKAAREEAENLRKSLDATTAEARATTTESVDAAVAAKIHAANLQVQLDVANADAAEASRSALDEAQAAKTAREEAENLRAKLWRDRVARSETVSPRPHASQTPARVRVVVYDDARVATTNSRRDENSRACATVCPFARVRRMGVARERETAPSRVGATRNGASDEKREGDDVSRVAANRAREYRGSGRESRSRGGGESPQEPGCDYGGSSRNDDRIGGCGSGGENPRSESSSTTRRGKCRCGGGVEVGSG